MAETSPAGGDAQANSTTHAPAPAAAPPADPPAPDVAAIRAAAIAEANAAAAARAKAISALCDLAGVPARATAFITEGKSEAEVRDTLLAERAAASGTGGEISGSRGAAPPAGARAGPLRPGSADPSTRSLTGLAGRSLRTPRPPARALLPGHLLRRPGHSLRRPGHSLRRPGHSPRREPPREPAA